MKTLFGISGLKVKSFTIPQDDVYKVNKFLADHDMDIVEIQTVLTNYGYTKYIIIYREEEA